MNFLQVFKYNICMNIKLYKKGLQSNVKCYILYYPVV